MSGRLRIAFVADTLLAPIGGGVVAARHLVERLRQEHEVVVIGADAEGEGRMRGFQLPLRAMRESGFSWAVPGRGALARIFAGVDVVHLQFPFWLSFASLAEARSAGRPVVAAFHVQPENALVNVGLRSPWLNRAVYRFWIDRLYGRVDAVVCPTEFAERKLREHGLRTPTFVVSNGVPPDVVPGPAAREQAQEGKFLVLMAGRLAAEKRQEVLIEAVRRSRHRDRLAVVIAGAGALESRLRRRARGLPIELGFQPRERLLSLLRSADLFVHCGEVELEGIAVLEALAAGLPALVADAPESAASELALGRRFLFPAGDAGALAARLDALIEDPGALAEARALALQRARSRDFAASVGRLAEIYREIAGEHRRGGGSARRAGP